MLFSFGIRVQIAEKCEWNWNSLTLLLRYNIQTATYPKIKFFGRVYICIQVQKKWYACCYNFWCICCCCFYIFSSVTLNTQNLVFSTQFYCWQCFPLLFSLGAHVDDLVHQKLCTVYVLLDDKFLPDDLARWLRNHLLYYYYYCYIIFICKQTIGPTNTHAHTILILPQTNS